MNRMKELFAFFVVVIILQASFNIPVIFLSICCDTAISLFVYSV